MKSQTAGRNPCSREFSTIIGRAVKRPSWTANCWLRIAPRASLLTLSLIALPSMPLRAIYRRPHKNITHFECLLKVIVLVHVDGLERIPPSEDYCVVLILWLSFPKLHRARQLDPVDLDLPLQLLVVLHQNGVKFYFFPPRVNLINVCNSKGLVLLHKIQNIFGTLVFICFLNAIDLTGDHICELH
ncbi:hypothetical protein EUGRSUZ_D00624 [Eucalyptus grandis]|uniref:Uncharacterized protein n=1 Tax=Eucalyptus grandis TaxID=71139 RepID=A0A059CDA9_EUCGR|nr:hypothetical protein EUGRSUZ_D00624 [Eucalyptus grandis]